MSGRTQSGLRRSTVCWTLIVVVLLTFMAMVVFAVLVSQGIARENLDIVAGEGKKVNCTLLSKNVQSRRLEEIWWWAVYTSDAVGSVEDDHSQTQAIYYNTVTEEGLDLTGYEEGDSIDCYCDANFVSSGDGSRCVLWSPSKRDPNLEALIIGLIVTVLCLAIFGCFTGEIIRTMAEHGELNLPNDHGGRDCCDCCGLDETDETDLEEKRPVVNWV